MIFVRSKPGDVMLPAVPPPSASSPIVRRRMRNVRQRDTPVELALRRELHRLGLGYRVDVRPLRSLPRRADVVFFTAHVAVFVDGCFWHSCPEHGTTPKTNTEWWQAKLARTRERDAETVALLQDAGWAVIRMWEHEEPLTVAKTVHGIVKARR